ncbi:MAG TPA: DUF503 domain-containing protein [Desulfitobacteriaceae bacterium]|jgi:hypothetical protein|nr:DUF503 domain-containing protein [Desulfitobacteriaceae bacterium]
MIIGTIKIKFYASWVHSLKEKRMIVKSICTKVRNKYNVSIAEVAEQDTPQIIVLGIACVAGEMKLADSIIDNILNFIEQCTGAEIIKIEREML